MELKTALRTIVTLSILGLITSMYLTYNHYAPPQAGALCDLGKAVSCSLVNTSIYSRLLNVPVALFGALWFVILGLMSWKAMKRNELIPGLLAWSIIGTLFVIYMITAEIILQAICPFCTIVHLMVFTGLILSACLYRTQNIQWNWSPLKKWIAAIILINALPIILFNWSEEGNYEPLAQCMTERGVVMYSSFRCGICARTQEMFGDSFQHVKEIECHPKGENARVELCLAKQIEKTPTWTLEQDGQEIKRHIGFLSIEELREFSGCQE